MSIVTFYSRHTRSLTSQTVTSVFGVTPASTALPSNFSTATRAASVNNAGIDLIVFFNAGMDLI